MSDNTEIKSIESSDIFIDKLKIPDDYIEDAFGFGMSSRSEKQPPSLLAMAGSLTESLLKWAESGLHVTDPTVFETRIGICKGCEFWDGSGFAKTGRCKKCGCSTQAKLRMATEKCPIGKW